MTGNKVKQDKSISIWEDVAEWHKDPEYMKAYESLKPKYDRLRRQIDRRQASRQPRAAHP